MQRALVFVVLAVGAALTVPQLAERTLDDAAPAAQPAAKTVAPAKRQTSTTGSARRSVILSSDSRGHFQGSFRINGRTVDGLIDTGASVIALNRSTARKLGLSVKASDFTYKVNTANGIAKAAHAVLKRVEIQSIRVDNVDALILDDKSLSGTLIGMSFLNKLGSYQARDGKLVLKAR
ncbi:MAG: TIGR02281 family clan AA aspartic protease [Alphaproteobacteria bacterium]|nr:TIGR02281 family clan AA aspartic protease [Alphaproteobacteria bacterium]